MGFRLGRRPPGLASELWFQPCWQKLEMETKHGCWSEKTLMKWGWKKQMQNTEGGALPTLEHKGADRDLWLLSAGLTWQSRGERGDSETRQGHGIQQVSLRSQNTLDQHLQRFWGKGLQAKNSKPNHIVVYFWEQQKRIFGHPWIQKAHTYNCPCKWIWQVLKKKKKES